MGILILILKILGIILAIIIGIILLLLFVLLFASFSYVIDGEFHDEVETLYLKGRGRWLFGILKINGEFTSDGFKWNGKILWFDLKKSKPEKVNKKVRKKKEDELLKIEQELEEAYLKEISMDDIEDIIAEDIEIDDTDENDVYGGNIQSKKIKKEKRKVKKRKALFKKKTRIKKIKEYIKRILGNIKEKFENISNTIKGICATIKSILEKKDKVISFYYMDVHQYAIKKIKSQLLYLFKRLKPRKLSIKGNIGFEDPSITGRFIGVVSVLYPIYGNTIDVIPDFQNKVYDFTLFVKGRIRIFPFVVVALRMILDENMRKTYKNIRGFKL